MVSLSVREASRLLPSHITLRYKNVLHVLHVAEHMTAHLMMQMMLQNKFHIGTVLQVVPDCQTEALSTLYSAAVLGQIKASWKEEASVCDKLFTEKAPDEKT